MLDLKLLRNRHFFLLDIGIACLTPELALLLHLDGLSNYHLYIWGLLWVTLSFLAIKLVIFYQFGLYKQYWQYASIDELIKITKLIAIATVIQIFLFESLSLFLELPVDTLPHSLPIIDGILTLVFVGISRFSIRLSKRMTRKVSPYNRCDRILIIGAGVAGIELVKTMQGQAAKNWQPIAFIDDDPTKLEREIQGITVVGNRDDIPKVVESLQIDRVIIAMPSLPGTVIQDILKICQSTGIQTSTLPGIDEIINHHVQISSIREVEIKDLLRRDPIQTEMRRITQFIAGKTVLITGAGGSIGSEICRQVLKCNPAEIVLLGHGENSIFNIERELRQTAKILYQDGTLSDRIPRLTPLIADIRCLSRLENAFAQFKYDLVFHAAAHKHVPLMEINTAEAITNNVEGTHNLVDLALKYNVPNFVMISTDKAVNPTNIMGASKRVAEMLVLQAAQKTGKSYSVVRFGNVLGSRGSVIPIFKQQIAAGGPVTVTHPEIRRYFITIPEAVQLTLQASVLGRRGEIIMLNMGEPIEIVDLATELIRLSGLQPGKEIEIQFTGLRPGEKLFEELFIPGEDYEPIESDKLFICKNASRLVAAELSALVPMLCLAAIEHNIDRVVALLQQLVPEYQPKQPHDVVVSAMAIRQLSLNAPQKETAIP